MNNGTRELFWIGFAVWIGSCLIGLFLAITGLCKPPAAPPARQTTRASQSPSSMSLLLTSMVASSKPSFPPIPSHAFDYMPSTDDENGAACYPVSHGLPAPAPPPPPPAPPAPPPPLQLDAMVATMQIVSRLAALATLVITMHTVLARDHLTGIHWTDWTGSPVGRGVVSIVSAACWALPVGRLALDTGIYIHGVVLVVLHVYSGTLVVGTLSMSIEAIVSLVCHRGMSWYILGALALYTLLVPLIARVQSRVARHGFGCVPDEAWYWGRQGRRVTQIRQQRRACAGVRILSVGPLYLAPLCLFSLCSAVVTYPRYAGQAPAIAASVVLPPAIFFLCIVGGAGKPQPCSSANRALLCRSCHPSVAITIGFMWTSVVLLSILTGLHLALFTPEWLAARGVPPVQLVHDIPMFTSTILVVVSLVTVQTTGGAITNVYPPVPLPSQHLTHKSLSGKVDNDVYWDGHLDEASVLIVS